MSLHIMLKGHIFHRVSEGKWQAVVPKHMKELPSDYELLMEALEELNRTQLELLAAGVGGTAT